MKALFIVVMVLGAAGMSMAWPPWKHHMSVNIINQVGGLSSSSSSFAVHCKSRDNDLGAHTVWPNQQYGFGFYPNFSGTTLFWCTFQWGSKSQGFTVWQDIGPWGRQRRLCNQCVYTVTPESFWRSEGRAGPFSKVCDWKRS